MRESGVVARKAKPSCSDAANARVLTRQSCAKRKKPSVVGLPTPEADQGAAMGKSSTLRSAKRPDQTLDAVVAEMMVDGIAMNAVTAVRYSQTLGELDLSECVTALKTATRLVNDGDLADTEALLTAQAVALNTVFTELARRAVVNFGEYLDAGDRYLRLALKAQSQCRATIETLALMKNPRTVFAKQANITSGPQQVNNGVPAPALASRAGNLESEPNKLLEAHGERLDGGATGTAGSGDQDLATVGPVNRAKKPRR